MFDRIAHRYDLLNRLLSFGTDVRWRKKMAKRLSDKSYPLILDLATGTCDQLISLHKNTSIEKAIGVDRSYGMLEFGQQKIDELKLNDKITLVQGDATALPLKSNEFDAVTISFGIRNVIDVEVGLKEMARILKPGGKCLILEFGLPKNVIIRSSYLFYFRYILPLIGGLISGDSYAYNYLNKTVETFPYGNDFCELMEKSGFKTVSAKPLTFGVAYIYEGVKA